MGRFNFVEGASVTVRVKRSRRPAYLSTASIPAYGEVVAAPTSGSAWLGRVETVPPPAGWDIITRATEAEGRARITPRQDGLLTVNMLDHDGSTSALTIALEGTRNGVPDSTGTMTVKVNGLREVHGQGRGLHPAPHVTGTGVVYYPSVEHRVIHVALDGFTQAEIEAREAYTATGRNLAANTALDSDTLDPPLTEGQKGYNPGGVRKYGETPDLAIDRKLARQLAQNGLGGDRLRSVEIRLRAGDDATIDPELTFNAGDAVGRGPLHPCIISTYGDGDRPVYNHSPANGYSANHANWITHGFTIRGEDLRIFHAPYSAFVDMRFDNGSVSALLAKNSFCWGFTAQYYVSLRNVIDPAGDGTGTWKEKPTHETGIYVQSGHSTLIKDAFLFHTGWAPCYDPGIADDQPDPPEMWSQGAYISAGAWSPSDVDDTPVRVKDVTLSDVMATEAAANGLQLRPGGVILGGFYGRNNINMLIAGGPSLSPSVKDGNYSYGFGFVVSGVAHKTTKTGNSPVTGKGLDIGAISAVLDDYIVANRGDPHPPEIALTDVKATSSAVNIKIEDGELRTPRYNRGVVHGWSEHEDSTPSNPNEVPTAELDDISATTWMDEQFPGGAPHTWEDFNDYCEASETPWEIEAAFRTWARTKAGYDETPRRAAQFCTFRPHPTIPTPGCRWDIGRDWSGAFAGRVEHNIPGMVAGLTDDVDLDGHWVSNYLSLVEALRDFAFGAGGHLHQVGGHLAITGDISGSGTLETDQRGIVRLDTTADFSAITPIIGGRLENHGTLTGVADYEVHGYGEFLLGVEGSRFTLPSGARLTLDGPLARAGWDGGAGGTATANFAAGSTVRIKPGMALEFSGYDNSGFLFVPGSTLRGATSGATARIGTFWHFNQTNQASGVMYLDRVTGTFEVGEDLIGQRYDHFAPLEGQTIGQVSGITVMIPHIRKECFGGFGAAAPNVIANVALGGAWEVDMTNIANGVHTLLDCDAVTGRPSGFTATGLGSGRNATLAVGAKTVTLTLEAGSGQAVLA